MPSRTEHEPLRIDGHEVSISNPRKLLPPEPGYSKLDLARYYLAVAQGAVRADGGHPNMLVLHAVRINGRPFHGELDAHQF